MGRFRTWLIKRLIGRNIVVVANAQIRGPLAILDLDPKDLRHALIFGCRFVRETDG